MTEAVMSTLSLCARMNLASSNENREAAVDALAALVHTYRRGRLFARLDDPRLDAARELVVARLARDISFAKAGRFVDVSINAMRGIVDEIDAEDREKCIGGRAGQRQGTFAPRAQPADAVAPGPP